MRILVVTHNYPRFPGDPAGAYVARLARAAVDGGVQIRVLAPHTAGAPEREEHAGVHVRRFRYGPAVLERVGYRGDAGTGLLHDPLTAAVVPIYLMRFRQAARRTVREFAPTVTHAHWWFPGGWVAAGLGVPYVVTSHGSDARLFDRGTWWRRVGRTVLTGAGAVTTVSRFLAADLARCVPELNGKVTVAPMPIDVEAFTAGNATSKAQPPRILYAGNLVASKGVDVLLRAIEILVRERAIGCRLRVLGEGPERKALESLARELRIAEHVEWSNFVPQHVMPAEYGASTVAVLPSRGQAEGLGLTLVEALLAGCAVVATPAGGIPEVVQDGETGLLFRDGDAADLADKISRLLRDSPLRARLTQTGQARVRDTYSAASAASRFLTLYDAVARGQPTR
jgi:glycosyltransferase involved in cell wall biosynthesis